MSENFIPLVLPNPSRPASHANTSNAAPSGSWQPLQRPRPAPATPAQNPPLPPSPAHPHPPAQITLQRQGDRVTHISIQCSCGQCIELECDY